MGFGGGDDYDDDNCGDDDHYVYLEGMFDSEYLPSLLLFPLLLLLL